MINLFTEEDLEEITAGKDSFQSPLPALEPMLPHLEQFRGKTIWEPARGEGNIERFLSYAGFEVIASDILTGQSFFDMHPNYDVHFTNPPYSIADKWLKECYERGKPFALLLPISMFGGKTRKKLYKRYGIQVLMLEGRIDFKTPTGKTASAGSSAPFEVAWFTWKFNLPDTHGCTLAFA